MVRELFFFQAFILTPSEEITLPDTSPQRTKSPALSFPPTLPHLTPSPAL